MCLAETLAVAPNGQVFAPNGLGSIQHAASLDAPLEEWAYSGGRPLGAMMNASGDLLVADAAHVCPTAITKHVAPWRSDLFIAKACRSGPLFPSANGP